MKNLFFVTVTLFLIQTPIFSQSAQASGWTQESKLSALKRVSPSLSCGNVPGPETGYDEKTLTLPRVLFKGPNKTLLWVCTDQENLQVLKKNQVLATANFSVFLRTGAQAPQQIAIEGEVMARPLEITAGREALTLTTYLMMNIGDQTQRRAFFSRELRCSATKCLLSSSKCAMKLAPSDDRGAVTKFDQAVKKYASARTEKNWIEIEVLLDPLFVLAVTGDKAARTRLEKFPIDVDAHAAEIVGTYSLYLKEAKEMGCGSK